MKLASLKDKRDGRLVIVSRDLSYYVEAEGYRTLQSALDDWHHACPVLKKQAESLKPGKPFDPRVCASPLPRAYQIADGSAYLSHVRLTRKSRGAEMPPEFLHDPLMYQAVSSTILGPCDDIAMPSEDLGIDYEAEVAVITDDVPMGIAAEDAAQHIVLVMLMNDVSLRMLVPGELAKGFGFFQAKPPSAFSPVAVTPDELGAAWKDYKIHLPIISHLNGREMGRPNAGTDMQFGFAQLIAHAARTRPLAAGTIIGSGTVSNDDRSTGVSCLVERRMEEKIEKGESTTPFLKFGDAVKIEMLDGAGKSIFGAIEQTVVRCAQQAGVDGRRKAV